MCVYDTDAEDISKARTRTIKPQNHDSAALERLVDLYGKVEFSSPDFGLTAFYKRDGSKDYLRVVWYPS